MTTPGSLLPRPSLLDVPPVPPDEMTAEEQEAWIVAQVAAITLGAAAAREATTNAVVLQLVPMLRLINPYNETAVTRFALEAASLVGQGIEQIGQIAWSAVSTRLGVQGYRLGQAYRTPTDGRTTDLAVAYKRVAADYRYRVSQGVESIAGTIQQAEEERFQAIGGAVVAEGRRGESNAEVKGTSRSPGKTGGSKSTSGGGSGADRSGSAKGSDAASGAGSAGKGGASSGGSGAGAGTPPKKSDRRVNETADDFPTRDADPAAGAPAAGDVADEDAARVEAELRREAALSDAEKQTLLEQVAQQEMEIRLERMVNDDMAMAARSAFRDAIQSAPKGVITGYRRVLHPELSQSGQSCGLCIAASTRIYKAKNLMPLHNLCNCEPVEIVKGRDVGDQINDEDLEILYGEAGDSTHRTDLSNTKWTVFEHPELGPVLRSVPRNKKRKPVDIEFSSRESASDRGGQS
ncbi:MuF-like minor capsid protein [Gordonia phage Bonum]|uniref:MuF-like minor capsid protein n=2 Tax=Kablunavirus TaxID=2948776 RepID=A0A2D1GCW8_9CAUD|nr:head maturation protease [Gordonia phage Kabluna]YP_010101153.1 head maturation protease [Gordonia phage NosilaM]ATN89550.1 MuF-like minor capsid protein [Gordonia phage Kabluna]QAU07272.1 MuF-like minor capsid protein [Gordonia phage NosilaM]QXN73334.1 MuF-like minor capsid protein [Gordonia phage Bonum]